MYRPKSTKGRLKETERRHGQFYWIMKAFAWKNWEGPRRAFMYPFSSPRLETMMTYWSRSRMFFGKKFGQPDLGSRQGLRPISTHNESGVKRSQLDGVHPVVMSAEVRHRWILSPRPITWNLSNSVLNLPNPKSFSFLRKRAFLSRDIFEKQP